MAGARGLGDPRHLGPAPALGPASAMSHEPPLASLGHEP